MTGPDALDRYSALHRQSLADPATFWAQQAERLVWQRRWDRVLDRDGESETISRWFVGGEINACYNCVDRHVEEGYGEAPAILYESPVTGASRTLTFLQVQHAASHLAGALQTLSVQFGDRVLIYMPNSPEAVIAMLACARIGAIHSVVFGGFAAAELASRIDDARPTAIIAASCGIEGAKILPYQPILQEAAGIACHVPSATIYWQRPQRLADLKIATDHDWNQVVSAATPAECVRIPATHPLYILYTSGTTGRPKGVVRDTGGHLTTLNWSMDAIYDCPPGEVFWAASDVGWVVGHSYIGYGPLLHRNPTVIFEGKPVGTPDAGIFWRTIAKHAVRTFFTAPTAIRAIKQQDPLGELAGKVDLTNLRAVFLAGERTDPDTLDWLQRLLRVPVIDHWWQTESGSAMTANPLGIASLPIKSGSSTVAMPGWDLVCLDPAGHPVAAGETGFIAARLPLPPGFSPTLWNAADHYREVYLSRFPGFYLTGDAGFIDTDGYVHVMARIDDVINVAGHRLSSAAMEEVLTAHPDVAECAVIGVEDRLKGHVPVGFVVLNAATEITPARLADELIEAVRTRIGPVAAFKRVHIVDKLPKTRSGKILRKAMRQIAAGERPPTPPTIEDPAALEGLIGLLQTR